jgi:integrase
MLIKTDDVPINKMPYLDESIRLWLKKVKINDLKERSYDRLEQVIESYIVPVIGHYEINKITDNLIQDEIINEKAKKLSHSSVKKMYDALNAFFKYTVARRLLKHNPMQTVNSPKKANFEKEIKEIEILGKDEINKIINVAELTYKNGKLVYKNGWAIVLMIYIGVRAGEALGLRWDDWDKEENVLNIRRNLIITKNREDEGAKNIIKEQATLKTTKSKRAVNLSQMAIKALKELEKTREGDYIISTASGNFVSFRNLQKLFDNMLNRAEIEHKGLHITRHTFASLLFELGVDVKTVSELLGHSNTAITHNTYIHLIPKQKSDAISVLDQIEGIDDRS